MLRVERSEHAVLVEDVIELALEAHQFILCQPEAGEMGYVLDVGTGQGGHAGMIPDGTRAERRGPKAAARSGAGERPARLRHASAPGRRIVK